MVTPDEIAQARAELDTAVGKWLKVKSHDVDPDDGYDADETELLKAADPVLLGYVVVACYTSIDLEREDATGYSYDCPDGQPAAFSRGLALAGVDRRGNR